MEMKETPEDCAFSSSIGICASSSDREILLSFSKQKIGSPTLRAVPPIFRLHPSYAPFLLIPIETKEMTNGNRRTNHPH